ncbi:hypothetical protein E3N88_40158 [Mikania micrantha]|uniref:Uncharacterized protein n=1 Tax=Mikania micrantha TaxID=192012 RepID=A0A5N6LMQ1_9ASTR|nr:hypothetical protein E3N88_40158 [Mikania micrantha]
MVLIRVFCLYSDGRPRKRYIYQRFPYVILDDTPSSSSGSDSDPSEASAAASQADIPLPQTPPAPVPAPVPVPVPAPMPSPPRAPAWDGLRRMRGQACKTTAMADQGERYIYQRFPYVILDDTPSSSSGSDSDPSEASAAASQADIPLPQTPPAPVPAPVPVPVPAPMPSPPRAPAWDGLRRMREMSPTPYTR